jgi:Tfp pilus assembly protein PilF
LRRPHGPAGKPTSRLSFAWFWVSLSATCFALQPHQEERTRRPRPPARALLKASPRGPSSVQAVAPLLRALKASPDDFATIVNVANLYYDGRQFPEAIRYYRRAVKIQPYNADVLTDMGTSLWYTGDADQAIANFEQALKYRPDSPEALFNLGVVRWQGKMDPKGATQAWEKLLERNPNYPQRQQVEEYIVRAKQHLKG